MNHPLTDQMCGDIAENLPDYNVETCMRAAADWQLEQVLMWLEETEYDQYHFDKIVYASDLLNAMRPQQQENSQ